MMKYFRWVRHVACIGGREVHTGFRWGNFMRPLGTPKNRWKDIQRVFKNDDGMIWTGLIRFL
jgi:hypothetical protein